MITLSDKPHMFWSRRRGVWICGTRTLDIAGSGHTMEAAYRKYQAALRQFSRRVPRGDKHAL
jgi:hypothetical protein